MCNYVNKRSLVDSCFRDLHKSSFKLKLKLNYLLLS